MTDTPTVFQAWNAVMTDVESIGKDSYNKDQNFRFRGVDTVVDKVGPALRKHGVIVIPSALDHEAERYVSKKGANMLGETVKMSYTIYGPAGDSFTGSVYGAASDAGDKAMPKAESVALRVFLLQALMVPTGDADPDSEAHERGQADPGLEEANQARGDMLTLLQPHGWTPDKLIKRFEDDYSADLLAADTATVKAFAAALEDEAKAQDSAAQPSLEDAAEETP